MNTDLAKGQVMKINFMVMYNDTEPDMTARLVGCLPQTTPTPEGSENDEDFPDDDHDEEDDDDDTQTLMTSTVAPHYGDDTQTLIREVYDFFN